MYCWVQGQKGPTGLRYESFPFVFEMMGIARDEWNALFEDIQIMEHEALKTIYEQVQDG